MEKSLVSNDSEKFISCNKSTPLAAVIVWYNPSEKEVQNINNYGVLLDNIYIIDNSEHDNSNLLSMLNLKTDKVLYAGNMENIGIAAALNKGCRLASEDGFHWVLTMDQDSSFSEDEFKKYISCFENKRKQDCKIAIFAPITGESQTGGYIDAAITSGNLLNLIAYNEIGGFDDALFIDEVDFDLCYRLTRNNYKIYLFDRVYLNHKIGASHVHKFLYMKKIYVMHHSAIRKYYMVRNRCIICKRYPELRYLYMKNNLHLIFSVLFFEKNKYQKIIHMLKGYVDSRKGKLGKY